MAVPISCFTHLPGSSVGKASACTVGDLGSISGSGSSPGKGNGNPLQYSCLGIPMDRGTCQAMIHGISRVKHNLALSFLLACFISFLTNDITCCLFYVYLKLLYLF